METFQYHDKTICVIGGFGKDGEKYAVAELKYASQNELKWLVCKDVILSNNMFCCLESREFEKEFDARCAFIEEIVPLHIV